MSRNLTITMLPQNNSTNALGPSLSSWYYEEETYCDCSQTVHVSKEIQNSYKDLDIRWQIPTTITSFDPEEILRISKIASENGIKVSASVDYMHLEILRPFAHLLSQVEIPVDSLAIEAIKETSHGSPNKKISLSGLRCKIESLRQINKNLRVKFRTVVDESNFTEILVDSLQEFENSEWKILRQDADSMRATTDFKLFSFLRNNVMGASLPIEIRNSTKEPCLVVSSRGKIMKAKGVECIWSRQLTEVSMDDLPDSFEFYSPEVEVRDGETGQLISSMKKMFNLFTDEDASDEMWSETI